MDDPSAPNLLVKDGIKTEYIQNKDSKNTTGNL
jgi:hypothetical protein